MKINEIRKSIVKETRKLQKSFMRELQSIEKKTGIVQKGKCKIL